MPGCAQLASEIEMISLSRRILLLQMVMRIMVGKEDL